MHPSASTPDAGADHPAVHVALGLPSIDGREDFQVSVVEDIGPALEERDLGWSLDVPNLFHHVGEMLHAAGADWQHVVKMNFYLPSLDLRKELNEPWVAHFPDPASRPARHTQVGGPTAQCDFIAYVDD